MPLVHVKVIEGVFSANQKRQIVEGVTEVLVSVQDEGVRDQTWVIVDEVGRGHWAIGGRVLAADDIRDNGGRAGRLTKGEHR